MQPVKLLFVAVVLNFIIIFTTVSAMPAGQRFWNTTENTRTARQLTNSNTVAGAMASTNSMSNGPSSIYLGNLPASSGTSSMVGASSGSASQGFVTSGPFETNFPSFVNSNMNQLGALIASAMMAQNNGNVIPQAHRPNSASFFGGFQPNAYPQNSGPFMSGIHAQMAESNNGGSGQTITITSSSVPNSNTIISNGLMPQLLPGFSGSVMSSSSSNGNVVTTTGSGLSGFTSLVSSLPVSKGPTLTSNETRSPVSLVNSSPLPSVITVTTPVVNERSGLTGTWVSATSSSSASTSTNGVPGTTTSTSHVSSSPNSGIITVNNGHSGTIGVSASSNSNSVIDAMPGFASVVSALPATNGVTLTDPHSGLPGNRISAGSITSTSAVTNIGSGSTTYVSSSPLPGFITLTNDRSGLTGNGVSASPSISTTNVVTNGVSGMPVPEVGLSSSSPILSNTIISGTGSTGYVSHSSSPVSGANIITNIGSGSGLIGITSPGSSASTNAKALANNGGLMTGYSSQISTSNGNSFSTSMTSASAAGLPGAESNMVSVSSRAL